MYGDQRNLVSVWDYCRIAIKLLDNFLRLELRNHPRKAEELVIWSPENWHKLGSEPQSCPDLIVEFWPSCLMKRHNYGYILRGSRHKAGSTLIIQNSWIWWILPCFIALQIIVPVNLLKAAFLRQLRDMSRICARQRLEGSSIWVYLTIVIVSSRKFDRGCLMDDLS